MFNMKKFRYIYAVFVSSFLSFSNNMFLVLWFPNLFVFWCLPPLIYFYIVIVYIVIVSFL